MDTATERRALADRLMQAGALRSKQLHAAVDAVPREAFLRHGVFMPTDDERWRPVSGHNTDPREWIDIAYRDESLVTQLDGHLTADQATAPVAGSPTSSSTDPALVVSMIEDLELTDGESVLEIGTGTGYSTALLCHWLGEDQVTTIEVDPEVAARADTALETAGYSTWTITGDGLVGHPFRAPYDRVIATCAVRRIPYAWVRQTRPGGSILATVGTWSYGAGLAKVTVGPDGTANGRIIRRSSFMPARAHAETSPNSLSARAAYPDNERRARLSPRVLDEWMPAFLAQLAAPGALKVPVLADGQETLYLVDTERESVAALVEGDGGWTVRQSGPVALWDAIEDAVLAWETAGRPDIDAVRLRITSRAHTYSIDGDATLSWVHRVA